MVTLDRDMAERIAGRVPSSAHVEVVPVWSDVTPAGEAAVAATRSQRGWRPEDLVFQYSGNMGRGHRLAEFLEAARRLGAGGPIWAFLGGGSKRKVVERFRREHGDARVQLLPYVPAAALGASLGAADVHLVSVSAAWRGVIVPSKLQAAFSVSRPVLFVGPVESEMARWIRESGGGWIAGEDDVDAVLAAVAEAHDPGERRRRGEAAAAFSRRYFDPVANCRRVADLLEHQAAKGLR
jgi:glycosyltransferase involved in cell wall biosynthesis